MTHIARLSLACLLALLAATTAHAAPYELTVYSDDISAPGETEFESVFSIARPASRTGLDGPVEQALGEINYGIAKGFEIGLELPASYSKHRLREDGLAIEIEYLAPHDKVDGWFVGIRGDLGRVRSAYDEDDAAATDLDLDPIIGYRGHGYRMVFNPSLETSLSVGNKTARFQPSAKLAIQIAAHDELGTEYFGDWGPYVNCCPTPDGTKVSIWSGTRRRRLVGSTLVLDEACTLRTEAPTNGWPKSAFNSTLTESTLR